MKKEIKHLEKSCDDGEYDNDDDNIERNDDNDEYEVKNNKK
jgi:hypothetical protein